MGSCSGDSEYLIEKSLPEIKGSPKFLAKLFLVFLLLRFAEGSYPYRKHGAEHVRGSVWARNTDHDAWDERPLSLRTHLLDNDNGAVWRKKCLDRRMTEKVFSRSI